MSTGSDIVCSCCWGFVVVVLFVFNSVKAYPCKLNLPAVLSTPVKEALSQHLHILLPCGQI